MRERQVWGFAAVVGIACGAGFVCGRLDAPQESSGTVSASVLVVLPEEPVGFPGMTPDDARRMLRSEIRDILAVTDQPCLEAARRLILLRRGVTDERRERQLVAESERLVAACIERNAEVADDSAGLLDGQQDALRDCHDTLAECYDGFDAALGIIERDCDDAVTAFPPMTVPTSPDVI